MEKSENQNRSANLTGSIADGVVYTFRHLVSSTKEAMSYKAERMSVRNTPPFRMSPFPFH